MTALNAETSNPLPQTATLAWSPVQRVAFRFACAYLVLYNFPSPLGIIPYADSLAEPYEAIWKALVPWVGRHVLHLDGPFNTAPTGSGDTTIAYVRLFCVAVLALVITLAWSLADAKRPHYAKAYDALRTYIRYVLGSVMIMYGVSKVFVMQFPFPDATRLIEPYGESSPMGLMWAFMGYSAAYSVFGGCMEVLGGVLVLFRRTTTLGALVLTGVMSNVAMLNFCYDVPVKLFSSHLLSMAVFLMLPDLGRLVNLFVLNRPTAPARLGEPFKARWMERSRWALKALYIGAALIGSTVMTLQMKSHLRGEAPPLPFHGTYQVEAIDRDGQALPLLITDAGRWRWVVVGRYGRVTIKHMNDTVQRFTMRDEPEKKTVTLKSRDDTSTLELAYSQIDPDHLVLEGRIGGEALRVRLRRFDESRFLLVSRGFHWINETPFNR